MVRIKGVNSDYQFDAKEKGVREVKPPPEQLYMKLFICPNDEFSTIENIPSECCHGESKTCPGRSKSGHAMIQLHQKEGISLVTDRESKIVIDQAGNIRLASQKSFEVEINGAKIRLDEQGNIELTPASSKQVKVTGDLSIAGDLTVTGTLDGKLSNSILQQLEQRFQLKSK
ncbi:MAG: hypothetical protein KME18_24355 [Phormidium tanganyikae FI6-MK23]|jgi:hypothetical protein|nr:hypothetical protein [Phormidium tanganyikae FI6-MK23]